MDRSLAKPEAQVVEGCTKELLRAFLSLITLTGSATSLIAFVLKHPRGPINIVLRGKWNGNHRA